MIASVTEQQAASVNSTGSASMSAGGMNNENDVPKNLNGSSNNQSFGQSNGMRNGDSFEFEKFKVRKRRQTMTRVPASHGIGVFDH